MGHVLFNHVFACGQNYSSAFTISELFTAVCGFKMQPHDLVFAPCDQVLCLWIVLYVSKAHTKFEFCSCSLSRNMDEIPKFKSRSRWPRLWPILTYFCKAYFSFEVSSFSCSKDIGVRILKIWVTSTILDSTTSEFSQFRLIQAATKYHLVKSERNLSTFGWVRAM